MSRCDYYKNESPDIINLANVAELKRIYRTDKYLEIGATVTFDVMLTVGKQVLPNLLQATLEKSGSTIVRRQMSIGGAICTPDVRLPLPVSLCALEAEVEIRTCAGAKTQTRWAPIERLYDRKGAFLLKRNELVSRIRLALRTDNFYQHIVVGNPMVEPDKSVILSLSCHYSQSVIDRFRMCIAFPSSLFLVPSEVNVQMHGTMLPLSTSQMERTVRSIMEEITGSADQEATPIQLERAKRFIESALHELNARSLIFR